LNSEQDKKAVILQVYGRVQGVGFRFYTQRKAQELEICGFVQNRSDGSVYIEAEGNPDALEQFIYWCDGGPSWARVSEVKKQFMPVRDYKEFRIR
jgi:acylphosphatase